MKPICPDIDRSKSPCLHYIRKSSDGQGYCLHDKHFRCIEHISQFGPTVSVSSTGVYNECMFKFWLSYIHGWRLQGLNLQPACGNITHCNVQYLHTGEDKFMIESAKLEQELINQYNDNDKLIPEKLPVEILNLKPVSSVYKHHGFHVFGGECEVRTVQEFDGYLIKSLVDIKKGNRIIDLKYTSNPDYYTFFTTEHQAGIYLLCHPNAEQITYVTIRVPDPWKGGKLSKGESVEDYQDRIERDMIRRKKHYFSSKTFHRGEYDFERIKTELFHTADEIKRGISQGLHYWRQNKQGCWQFGHWCDFYQCCKNRISPGDLPDIYTRMDVSELIIKDGEDNAS